MFEVIILIITLICFVIWCCLYISVRKNPLHEDLMDEKIQAYNEEEMKKRCEKHKDV